MSELGQFKLESFGFVTSSETFSLEIAGPQLSISQVSSNQIEKNESETTDRE